MKILTLVTALVLFYAMAALAEPQRIPVSFSGSGYNRAANQYLDAATFATIQPVKKGNDILTIEVDDPVWSDAYKSMMPRSLRWEKNSVPEYLAAIDKYAQWAEIATRDGDMITKEITRAKTKNGRIRFSMHSGNTQQHYLVADFCAVGTSLSDTALYFSFENAMGLRDALEAFGSGELTIDPNQSDKYQ